VLWFYYNVHETLTVNVSNVYLFYASFLAVVGLGLGLGTAVLDYKTATLQTKDALNSLNARSAIACFMDDKLAWNNSSLTQQLAARWEDALERCRYPGHAVLMIPWINLDELRRLMTAMMLMDEAEMRIIYLQSLNCHIISTIRVVAKLKPIPTTSVPFLTSL